MDAPSTSPIAGPTIQRSTKRPELPLRRSSTATRTEPAARKNVTIESPVFRAQQQAIQRRWKTSEERNAAFKDLKNSMGKSAKQFFSKVKKEKAKEPAQRSGGGDQNLDELAEKIMPIVKRMLAIERERRFGRTSNL